jgi:hypothetical protein
VRPLAADTSAATFAPVGPTTITSMSSGAVCTTPDNVTVAFVTKLTPEAVIEDGYGVAVPTAGSPEESLTVIVAGFEKAKDRPTGRRGLLLGAR